MNRPNWNEIYMEMCETLSKRSTCLRIQTASLIVKNNVIVSVGYNGVPSNDEHCTDYWINYWKTNLKELTYEEFLKSDFFYKHHNLWSNVNEIHGEMNAILFAGKNGISINDSVLYTLYSPCINCAKSILASGIIKVYYKYVYKRDTQGIEFLNKHNILTIQIN